MLAGLENLETLSLLGTCRCSEPTRWPAFVKSHVKGPVVHHHECCHVQMIRIFALSYDNFVKWQGRQSTPSTRFGVQAQLELD